MTPKQRFEAAMNFSQPEGHVAFMEVEFQLYKEYIGKEPIVGFAFDKLSSKEKEIALNYNAEIMVETAEKAGHDAIRNFTCYWEVSPGIPAYLWLPGITAEVEQLKAIKRVAGDKYFIIGNGGGTMGIPDGNQINDYVIDLYEQPDEMKVKLESMLRDGMERQKRFMEVGVDAIINCTDVAFNNGP